MFSTLSIVVIVFLHLSSARNDNLSKIYKFPDQTLVLADSSFDNTTLFYALHTQSSKQCTVVQEINPFTNSTVTRKCDVALKADNVQLVVGFGTEKAILITQESIAKSLILRTTTIHMASCKTVDAELIEVPSNWTKSNMDREQLDVVVSENGFEIIIKGLSHMCTKPDAKVYCGLTFDADGNRIEGPLIWPKMAYEKIDIISPVMPDATGQGYFFVNRDSSLLAFQFNRKGGPKYVKLWYTPIPHSDQWREGYSVANKVDGMCYSYNTTIGCWQTDQEGELKINTEFPFEHAMKESMKRCNTTKDVTTQSTAMQDTTTAVPTTEQTTPTQGITTETTEIQSSVAAESTIEENVTQSDVVLDNVTESNAIQDSTVEDTTVLGNATESQTIEDTALQNSTAQDSDVKESTDETPMNITTENITVQDILEEVITVRGLTTQDYTTQDYTTQDYTTQDTASPENSTENATENAIENASLQDETIEHLTVQGITVQDVTTQDNAVGGTTKDVTAQDITVQGVTTQDNAVEGATKDVTVQDITVQGIIIKGITVEGIVLHELSTQELTTQVNSALDSMQQDSPAPSNHDIWNLYVHNLRNGGFILLIITCPNRICSGEEDHYYLMKINAQGKLVGQLEINVDSKCNAENGQVLAKVFENDLGQYCSARLCKQQIRNQGLLETLVNCYCNADFK